MTLRHLTTQQQLLPLHCLAAALAVAPDGGQPAECTFLQAATAALPWQLQKLQLQVLQLLQLARRQADLLPCHCGQSSK
jgi:hypothetical protein